MPTQLPSSFASAAAASQASRSDLRSAARGGSGSGDWSRREPPRATNGTLTFRRPSTTPYASQQNTSETPNLSMEQLLNQQPATSNPEPSETRYSREQMLEIFRTQKDQISANGDISRLFMNNWDPGHANGTNGRGWGRAAEDKNHNHGPDACWDHSGHVDPIGLEEMSALEKSIFATDVNSPLKPPPQVTNNKEQGNQAVNGRKTSVSQVQGSQGDFGQNSPTAARVNNTRRRDASENTSFGNTSLNSPGLMGRFTRDEPSPFFNRKAGDAKDSEDRQDEGIAKDTAAKTASPFASLLRNNTAGSAIGSGSPSPWGGSPATTLPPMGNFGNFALGSTSGLPSTPSGEKRPGFGSARGESRLAHLMPKESSEDIAAKSAEALKSLETMKSWRSRPRTDTDPFGDEPVRTGSASLGGGQDSSTLPAQRRVAGTDTPTRQMSSDFGFAEAPTFRDLIHRNQGHQQTPGGSHGFNEPLSPTETNPYSSPQGPHRNDKDEQDEGSVDNEMLGQSRLQSLGGIPEPSQHPFSNLSRGAFEGSDISRNSSAGANRFPSLAGGLGGLGGLGSLGGWPSSANANPIGTPDRERQGFQGPFGNSLFSPMNGELQSPSLGGLGGAFGSGTFSASNTAGRNSKLGSLFPPAMQAQMQAGENNDHAAEEQRRANAFGAIGRNAFTGTPRETDSPLRTSKNVFDDLFASSSNNNNAQNAFQSGGEQAPETPQGALGQAVPTQNQQQQQPGSGPGSDTSSNQMPQAQQRQMVMPDRMRWVYLDPQGQVQGPWSGLEMHDWYKASFFTADLSVKKYEDAEFEPLGQLIRRIGNSREPFLVPQIGIPYGPPSAPQPGAPFGQPGPSGSTVQPGAVQPPFAGAFPSFGTTLTAEQQNNLERRKQEEQFLMARQREYLAQAQQVSIKQIQMQGLPAALHHHSSAHSLQSQPSFGSITSPIGMPPQVQMPGAQGVPNFFDGTRQASLSGLPADFFREDEMARLSLQDRQQLFAMAGNASAPGSQMPQSSQIASLFAQHPELQRNANQLDQGRPNEPHGLSRLQEFEQLRAQHDQEQAEQAALNNATEPIGPPQQQREEPQPAAQPQPAPAEPQKPSVPEEKEPETLSLTQQVQKAASAQQSPAPAQQASSPWAKVDTGLPMPFPPPKSSTPLPAPTAQRGRTTLPEALNVESRSRSETPDVTSASASVAPWAKETTEVQKGPSLKEIQEAEAKKAAKAEAAAAAARREALEREMRAQAAAAAAPAAGLPTTSTWATSSSPAPTAASSAWAKPAAAAGKATPAATTNTSGKKTLAEIQKEEELRKQKQAAAQAAANALTANAAAAAAPAGKRYAELASKPTAAPATGGGAWSTVGAGGKVKIPTGPSSSAPRPTGPTITTTGGVRPVAKPAATPVAKPVVANNMNTAQEEFNKWAKSQLKGLDGNIDVDVFLRNLKETNADAGIIADAVYMYSKLLDGHRFAEEYMRRKKLAEKGIVEAANSSGSNGVASNEGKGGWNEVAKKGPVREEKEAHAGYKVVAGKKKGRK